MAIRAPDGANKKKTERQNDRKIKRQKRQKDTRYDGTRLLCMVQVVILVGDGALWLVMGGYGLVTSGYKW